jgi:hypothetical protein
VEDLAIRGKRIGASFGAPPSHGFGSDAVAIAENIFTCVSSLILYIARGLKRPKEASSASIFKAAYKLDNE